MSEEWFDPRIALEVYAERIALQESIPNVLEHAFSNQIAFIKDKSKHKALFCTRRSAKSFTAGLYLVYTALHNPGSNCLFIGLTRESAKAIIWKDILTVLDTQYNLKSLPNKSDLTRTFTNGSIISITGVDADEEQMKKLLGRKFKLVCIDEASMYTINLQSLIDLIEPATVDEGGTICLMGTASNFPRGLFYDITCDKSSNRSWKLFQWTAHDNPYVAKKWKAKLEEIAEKRSEYMQTPQFKQWYLNQWVVDEEKLVYRFDIARNLIRDLPTLAVHNWVYVLGVDTGWEDDSAFVLSAYHVNHPYLYILRVYKKKKMTFDDVVIKIEEFMKDPLYAPHKIIIDGANKQGVESMRQRSSIPFEYADKQDKVTFIELCNSDLTQGKIKILNTPENRPLWEEMSSLVWVTEGDKIKYPKKEHPSLPNHLCFIAGTLIQTPKGEVPIESLEVGDLVETRYGPRKVKNTIARKTSVITLKMSDRSSITCTPDHPFWSVNRWIKAQDLTKMNQLFTWNQLQNLNELNSREFITTAPSKRDILEQLLLENHCDYIKKSGNLTTEKFPKGITFIIKIMMPLITVLRTLNALLHKSILSYIQKHFQNAQKRRKILRTLNRLENLQKDGIHLNEGVNGIETTGRKPLASLRQIVHGATQFIPNLICTKTWTAVAQENVLLQNDAQVESTISNSFAHGVKTHSSQTNMLNDNAVVCVAQDSLKQKEVVFNLTIEDDHEYFANGFLVANCDAFLYAWRCGWHYASIAPEKKTTLYSKEWYDKQSDSMWDRERTQLERNSEWPDEGSLGELG